MDNYYEYLTTAVILFFAYKYRHIIEKRIEKRKLLKITQKNLPIEKFGKMLILDNQEVKKTLLMGIIKRFGKNEIGEENPYLFESFVASVIDKCYGGDVKVTKSSGDYGIDIEHRKKDGLYLGQVKCFDVNNKVGFEPIAIIHSQIEKQGAKGGYIITSSDFTKNAVEYARGLKIDLINGEQLVDMWVNGYEKQYEYIQVSNSKFNPIMNLLITIKERLSSGFILEHFNLRRK